MHRISDRRMGGVSIRNFSMFRQLCGDDTLKSVAIVTNMWSEVQFETGLAREHELASDKLFFKPALEKGAQMIRHRLNTTQSAHQVLQFFLDKPERTLQLEWELVKEQRGVMETGAGREVDRELQEARRRYQEQLDDIRKELEDAMSMHDTQTREELEEAKAQARTQLQWAEHERERMAWEYEQDKRRTDEQMQMLRQRLAFEQAQAQAQTQAQAQNMQASWQAPQYVEVQQEHQGNNRRRHKLLRRVAKIGVAVLVLGAVAPLL